MRRALLAFAAVAALLPAAFAASGEAIALGYVKGLADQGRYLHSARLIGGDELTALSGGRLDVQVYRVQRGGELRLPDGTTRLLFTTGRQVWIVAIVSGRDAYVLRGARKEESAVLVRLLENAGGYAAEEIVAAVGRYSIAADPEHVDVVRWDEVPRKCAKSLRSLSAMAPADVAPVRVSTGQGESQWGMLVVEPHAEQVVLKSHERCRDRSDNAARRGNR